MAKIDRKTQRIFGGGLSAEPNGISQFGSLANGAAFYSLDPAVIQALDAWWSGWLAAVVGKKNPGLEDMNAIFYVITRQLAYLFQQGVAEWDTDTVYYLNSLCTSGGNTYRSLSADNQGNAVTDKTLWKMVRYQASEMTGNLIQADLTAGGPFNDYNPTGWNGDVGSIRFAGTPGAAVHITGLESTFLGTGSSGYSGKLLLLYNGSGQDVVLEHDDAGSAISNRFVFTPAADITIVDGQSKLLCMYDGKWRNVT
jgi:hypothetical protein